MSIDTAHYILLFVSVGLMLTQLFVEHKRLEHIFFAIFCGSLAMVAIKQLSADVLGPYQYIIGLGTCATCNAMWLVARAMFRGEASIKMRHILFALLVAGLVMSSQILRMAAELNLLSMKTLMYTGNSLNEFTQLMSSTILVLTFWEALRPATHSSKASHISQGYWLRYMYAFSFASGVLLCTVGINAFIEPANQSNLFPWFAFIAALQIMLTTQFVLIKQLRIRRVNQGLQEKAESALAFAQVDTDDSVVNGINVLLRDEKQFLKHNLKMIDLANALDVSEYKISRAIRQHYAAPNFNRFINEYRVNHAKRLLESPESQQWSILVIGLESGFSSVTSFNRVFKSMLGCSPGEYRLGTQAAHHAI